MTIQRRQWLGLVAGTAILGMRGDLLAAVPAKADTRRFAAKASVGQMSRYVAVVEVDGQLRLNPDGKGVKTQPVKVLGNFSFDERVLAAAQGKPTRVIRHYKEAQADIRVDKTGVKNALRDDVRTICLQASDDSITHYSPLGPLTRDELELLKISGEPLVWTGLLPRQPVTPSDTWKPADATLAMWMGIDVVTGHDVTLTYVKSEGNLAILELAGHLTGAIGGIATEMDLKAKLNYDPTSEAITWLALGIQEKRAIGHAAPGFDITARVRISAAPIGASQPLSDKTLHGVDLSLHDGATLLTHDSPGGFKLLHDRRWHVLTDHEGGTVLRMIDQGDLIAQCNISRHRDQSPGKVVSLETFQQEVATSLGKNIERVVDATVSESENGLRQLRVVAVGQAQEVPVQWTYYHVADDAGRNASLVVTLDARLVERFAELDRSLVNTLEFAARQEAQEATEQQRDAAEAETKAATTERSATKVSPGKK